MRYTIKGAYGLIDCGGTVANLGKEEYQRRYYVQLAPAHIKLSAYEDIDEDPKQLAKLKQAFKIISEKYVNIGDFKDSVESFGMNYKHYCRYSDNYSYKLLTEEEFDLLVEVLLWMN